MYAYIVVVVVVIIMIILSVFYKLPYLCVQCSSVYFDHFLFSDATVYVGGLDEKVSEPLLWELFLQAGPVVNTHMPKDRVTGQHQGEFPYHCAFRFLLFLHD